MFRLGCYNHVSDALATLHWLRLPQRVDFMVIRHCQHVKTFLFHNPSPT